MKSYKIVETDNYGGDYPDEKFVNLPSTSKENAQKIADIINEVHGGDYARRYWKVVESDYTLQPGFEP
jgi:hypothetical protein